MDDCAPDTVAVPGLVIHLYDLVWHDDGNINERAEGYAGESYGAKDKCKYGAAIIPNDSKLLEIEVLIAPYLLS